MPWPITENFARRRLFMTKLDLSGLTPFQKKALEVVKTIPYGETKSYKWVAERMGKPGAARAVGQALKKNPYRVVIPCHRVIRSNGKLGGYSKGIQKKKRLLKEEEIIK